MSGPAGFPASTRREASVCRTHILRESSRRPPAREPGGRFGVLANSRQGQGYTGECGQRERAEESMLAAALSEPLHIPADREGTGVQHDRDILRGKCYALILGVPNDPCDFVSLAPHPCSSS